MDADFLEHGPDPRLFNEWLSATFLGNNRTKTITTEKYDKICRYMMGDARSTNAKFRYWVKSKGFYLVSCEDASIGHKYQENELLIKHRPTVNASKRTRSTKCESRLRDLVRNPRKAFGFRKVAVVEDFYEIIKAVHVDKFGEHVGQKLTYRIISCIYSFLPREVVTHYLVNCAVCKPRMEKFGSGSKNCRSRIFGSANLDLHSENDVDINRLENETTLPEAELNSSGSENGLSESESEEKDCATIKRRSEFITLDKEDIYESENESEESLDIQKDTESLSPKESEQVFEPVMPQPTFEGAKSNFQSKVSPKTSNMKRERLRPSGSGRRLSYSTQTDEKLLNWVKKFQDNRVVVTREMLQKQALSLIQPECPEFKASSGWVEKFLVRHGIALPGMCRSLNNINADKNYKQSDETSTNGMSANSEPVIREPPNLSEIMSNVNVSASSPSAKDDDEENDDDEDDEPDENEIDGKKTSTVSEINPERLKAFNMFVRLFVDENLDRLVPISKQPKEKINAIIVSCQRQFPEFSDRARKRIRTYLKSCRRSSRLKEPAKRAAESMSIGSSHIPSNQLGEVNNILSQACFNESQEVTKRAKYDVDESVYPKNADKQPPSVLQNHVSHAHVHDRHGQKYVPFSSTSRTPPVKLSASEITAVRQLISGYRESAAFLYRSADELENLLKQSEQYYGQQNQQQQQLS